MVKKILIILIIIVFLLDWAALDDITTGNEPDYFLEYLIVFVSIPLLLTICYFLFRKKKNKIDFPQFPRVK